MKPNQSFESVYDFSNLYAAYRAARKGKRWKSTVAKVEANALEAVAYLQKELRDGTYRPGAYYEFFVYEPKKRLIQTNSIKDKIVQHAFCDQVLYPSSPGPLSWTTMVPRLGRAPISALTGSVTSCGSITAAMGARTDGC